MHSNRIVGDGRMLPVKSRLVVFSMLDDVPSHTWNPLNAAVFLMTTFTFTVLPSGAVKTAGEEGQESVVLERQTRVEDA